MRSLYAVYAALIDEQRPDVIVTQDLCAVCATEFIARAQAFR